MLRINATLNPAQVIYLHSSFNRAYVFFVHCAMSEQLLSITAIRVPIASLMDSANPNPAPAERDSLHELVYRLTH